MKYAFEQTDITQETWPDGSGTIVPTIVIPAVADKRIVVTTLIISAFDNLSVAIYNPSSTIQIGRAGNILAGEVWFFRNLNFLCNIGSPFYCSMGNIKTIRATVYAQYYLRG